MKSNIRLIGFYVLVFNTQGWSQSAPTTRDLPSQLMELPPIVDIALPDTPRIKQSEDTQTPAKETAEISVRDSGVPLVLARKSGYLYCRKKSGGGQFRLKSSSDCVVKIIDLATNRLEAVIWLRADDSFSHDYVPPSSYRIIYAEDIRKFLDGSVRAGFFGQLADVLEIRDGSRIRVDLSVSSTSHRVIPADAGEFARISIPKR